MAETNAVGIVARSATGKPAGAAATISSRVTISDPNVPKARPTMRSPSATVETSEPVSRTRPQNSPPSRPSSIRPIDRKMSQKLSPVASVTTRTSCGPRMRVGKDIAPMPSSEPPASGSSSHSESSGGVIRSVPSAYRTKRAA